MTDEPDQSDHARPLNRWDCPGIVSVGRRVLWDNEAKYLGFKPLRWLPLPKKPKPPPAKPDGTE